MQARIQQISDFPIVDVLPDKIGQPVDLPAGRRAQHELAVHLEILLELLIVQLPKVIDHGPVGVEGFRFILVEGYAVHHQGGFLNEVKAADGVVHLWSHQNAHILLELPQELPHFNRRVGASGPFKQAGNSDADIARPPGSAQFRAQ